MNKLFNKIASLSIGLALAIGVGVAIGTGANNKITSVKAASHYLQLTSIESIDENAEYVLGIDGTGFHYSGTSSWGLTALPSAQTPLSYKLTKAANNQSFKAETKISGTTYYLQVPTSNNFSMSTSSTAANTDIIIGTTQITETNYAVANKGTTARHIRLNGASGLRSYAGTTGDMAYFYKVVDDLLTFDFEDSTAHRANTSNNYTSENTYTENGITIKLMYADSVISGTPISGTANITGRVAKSTTNSPTITIGPMNLSSYTVSGLSYKEKSKTSLTTATSYSTNGTTWTAIESHDGQTTTVTKRGAFSASKPSTLYVRFTITIDQAPGSNTDIQIDDIVILGKADSVTPLQSISCSNKSINVLGTVNLASSITFTPSNATNKNVSFSLYSGSDRIDLDASTGIVTGKKGGTGVVRITPADTSGSASAINVTITVTSIAAPGITIGDTYIIYGTYNSVNYALTGISSNVGTAASYASQVPTDTYVLTAENGYYENTVAFKNGNNYLRLDSNSARLVTSDSVTKDSSWVVTWNSTTYAATIVNAVYQTREIKLNYNSGNPRFASYTTTGSEAAISLYPYHFKALTAISITEEIEVFEHDTAQIEVTYTPSDTTQTLLNWKSDDESVATVSNNGLVTGVAEGICTITAWFDADKDGVKDAGEISDTCDVYVYEFAATHTLVTNKSQLVNGAKVVIASNDANYDKVAATYSDNNIQATTAAFDRTNGGLMAPSNAKEFTVWNVDGHIVLSNGGYYLSSPNSQNNQLKHYLRMESTAYFDVENSNDGVTLTSPHSLEWEGVEDPYVLKFNNTNDIFSLYASTSTQKDATLYISVATVNTVQAFVDVFMHFDNVLIDDETDTNACRDEGSGHQNYFSTAMTVFNNDLTESQREDFVANYTDAFNRLNAWAEANGYEWDDSDMTLVQSQRAKFFASTDEQSGAAIAITVASILSVAALGGYFFIKKKKVQ